MICSIIKPYVEIVWSLSSTTPCGVLTVFKSPFTSAFTDTVHIHRDSKDRKNQKIINARGGAPAGVGLRGRGGRASILALRTWRGDGQSLSEGVRGGLHFLDVC